MRKLLIIGNGFDLAHKLPTSYMDFKQYLEKEYDLSHTCNHPLVPSTQNMPDGGRAFIGNEAIEFLYQLLTATNGSDWKNFEEKLGKIEYESYFEYEFLDAYDKEGDFQPFHSQTNYEIFSDDLYILMMELKNYFKEWIMSINTSSQITLEKMKFVGKKCDVISFNYTDTFTIKYNYNRILYLHGNTKSEVVFGHGSDEDAPEDFYTETLTYKGAQYNISNAFKKQVGEIIESKLRLFLDHFNNYREIYFWGFSFSEVDMPYIDYILKNCENVKVIYLENYDKKNKKAYVAKLRRLGFKGKIMDF